MAGKRTELSDPPRHEACERLLSHARAAEMTVVKPAQVADISLQTMCSAVLGNADR